VERVRAGRRQTVGVKVEEEAEEKGKVGEG